jgi:hypothetical protein
MLDVDGTVLCKIDPIEPTVSGADLVLRAHNLMNQLLLDMDRVIGKRAFISHLVLKRVKSEEKPDRKRGACSKARPRRQICDVMDLYALVDTDEFETFANRRMLDFIISADIFDPRVGNPAVVFKEWG